MILAHAINFSQENVNDGDKFILVTEDEKLRNYSIDTDSLKILSLSETIEYIK